MTILILTEFFPRDSRLIFTGGVEARTYHIADLAKKDFTVKVIANPFKQIAATPFSVFSRIYYLFHSFFKALNTKFDLIEGSNVTSYLPAFFAGKLKGKPTVAWIPDVLGKNWFAFGWLVGLSGYCLETIAIHLSWDRVIALSQVTKDKLIVAGIKPQKISIVHGGVDLSEFKPSAEKTRQGIICVARLVKTKRIKDLIAALAKIDAVNLTVVGAGPEKANLQEQAETLGISGRITWLENLTRIQLIEQLQLAQVFCLPSVVEGFGLVTVEAMATGLPAVVTDLPINRETCRDGQGALFFKPADADDLAGRIKELLTDERLYQQKQAEAIKLVVSYSWEKIYQQTKAVYLSL